MYSQKESPKSKFHKVLTTMKKLREKFQSHQKRCKQKKVATNLDDYSEQRKKNKRILINVKWKFSFKSDTRKKITFAKRFFTSFVICVSFFHKSFNFNFQEFTTPQARKRQTGSFLDENLGVFSVIF